MVDHYKLEPEIKFHIFTKIDTNVHTTGVLSDQDVVDIVQPIPKSDLGKEEDEYPVVIFNSEVKVIV